MNNLKDIHNTLNWLLQKRASCYIRISMNNLKDIHNTTIKNINVRMVVILGFQ